jgi:hypothetical protein
VAGVEVGWGVFGSEHSNRRWKRPVQSAVEIFRRDGRGQLTGCDLGLCMDPGVGASAALGQDALPGDALDGVGQLALNGEVAGLDLPAVEIGSVIGEGELPIHALEGIFSKIPVKFLGLLAALKHQIAYDILKLSCHCSFLTERSWSKSRISSGLKYSTFAARLKQFW